MAGWRQAAAGRLEWSDHQDQGQVQVLLLTLVNPDNLDHQDQGLLDPNLVKAQVFLS